MKTIIQQINNMITSLNECRKYYAGDIEEQHIIDKQQWVLNRAKYLHHKGKKIDIEHLSSLVTHLRFSCNFSDLQKKLK